MPCSSLVRAGLSPLPPFVSIYAPRPSCVSRSPGAGAITCLTTPSPFPMILTTLPRLSATSASRIVMSAAAAMSRSLFYKTSMLKSRPRRTNEQPLCLPAKQYVQHDEEKHYARSLGTKLAVCIISFITGATYNIADSRCALARSTALHGDRLRALARARQR